MEWKDHDLLGEVQSLDETAKRKVLIVSSVVVMVIVVAIWAVYFNDIVMAPASIAGESGQATSTAAASPAAMPTAPSSSGSGFWQTVGNDLSGLGNMFSGGHQYIQPSH